MSDHNEERVEVIAGSYERILYGLHCTVSGPDDSTSVHIVPIFQFPAHLTCVKTVSASPNGKWLATGAADDVVKVWDLRRRKEVGGLVGHDGDITSVVFPSSQYLLSASADGTLLLFRSKDWSMLRRFKGHKGRVNDVAVHPEGRVALTVGQDRCLRMWDLLGRSTGKSSTSTKLGAEAQKVRWNTAGDGFAVVFDREVRLYSIQMELEQTLTSTSKFHDALFRTVDGRDCLFVACEDENVQVFSKASDAEASEYTQRAQLTGHKNRVKALSTVLVMGKIMVITVSSDGFIRIFHVASGAISSKSDEVTSITSCGEYDTKGSRLVCLSAVAVRDDRRTPASTAAPRSEDEGDSDDDSDSSGQLEASSDSEASGDEEAAAGEESEDEEEAEAEEEADDGEWGGISS